jgi:L-threonylcarbamoyladenylate synthase
MPGCNDSGNGPDSAAIRAAARVLAAGGIIVYPTETLYGLGADACNEAALQRLVEMKGREAGKPIAVLISDERMLRDLVEHIPAHAEALMRRFWPGPLTIVLRARAALSPLLTGGGDGIGVRLSSHPIATSLVRALARPVTAPSANPAGMRAPASVDAARAYFGSRVDYYLDAGHLPGEPASTVVDARDGLLVIREGAVAGAAVRACLQVAV